LDVSVILRDGPASALFSPLALQGQETVPGPAELHMPEQLAAALEHAPRGPCIAWGIPFQIDELLVLRDRPLAVEFSPTTAAWLVFLHTCDLLPLDAGPDGLISPMRGEGQLAVRAADYVMRYANGGEERVPILRRRQIGAFQRRWGENCFEAVAHHKPYPLRASHEQVNAFWGQSQTRVQAANYRSSGDQPWPWLNWLWAWRNPHPQTALVGVRFEPGPGVVIVSAVSAGDAAAHPLRWRRRRKACLALPEENPFRPELDEHGLLGQIQLDMGQIISATPRPVYPNDSWAGSHNNQLPEQSPHQVLIEYTSHPDACFHLLDGAAVPARTIPVAQVEDTQPAPDLEAHAVLRAVAPARKRVVLRAVEKGSGKIVPVKLHVHGQWGEVLAPVDRHRIPNPAWFADYSLDFVHLGAHACTYIPGETTLDLPLGKVYVEVSKGFEIRPVREVVEVGPDTSEIIVEIERVLPWRQRGWITADTHVHFLSPMSALLEGAAEGVNVVNLLASQWGELMTNVGDFDGRTTWGSQEAGGDGEYLVRVGTENRQNVMGHISLLGYSGGIIAPMTTGGPDESALGDPIEILLTEWARQCKAQGGLAVLPHFPNPRAEHAASIVAGEIDAVEMTSWGNLYGGIDPYSLSDWYRYLNCGYLVPAVGGTDKMSASTAVGTVRTYARIEPDAPFTYQAWMEAIRRGETFVTYGPLLDFAVDGQPMGGRIKMSSGGGTVDVTWQAASATVPMSRVELVVNGEIRESVRVGPDQTAGNWSIRVARSSWLALLVRGHYPDKPEIVAAHSSPVMIDVAGSSLLAAADAVTILEQIEGALAYLDTIGTRADDVAYKRMRLVLTAAHRTLHNRMHQAGAYHGHTAVADHPEHH
jgi:hypothetical protein